MKTQLIHYAFRGVIGEISSSGFFIPKGKKSGWNVTQNAHAPYDTSPPLKVIPLVPDLGANFIFYNSLNRGLVLTISMNRVCYISSTADCDSFREIAFDKLKEDKAFRLFECSDCAISGVELSEDADAKKQETPVQYLVPLTKFLGPKIQGAIDTYWVMKQNKIPYNLSAKTIYELSKL
jgi:hypothetical protein